MDMQVIIKRCLMYKLYHNPNCSKSRAALKYIHENSIPCEVITYLSAPLTEQDLLRVKKKLVQDKLELVRTTDKAFEALNLNHALSENDIVPFLLKHPELMQRPILETENKAAIGRPLENILNIL